MSAAHSSASSQVIPMVFKSWPMVSIQFFLGLPGLRLTWWSICQYKACFGNLFYRCPCVVHDPAISVFSPWWWGPLLPSLKLVRCLIFSDHTLSSKRLIVVAETGKFFFLLRFPLWTTDKGQFPLILSRNINLTKSPADAWMGSTVLVVTDLEGHPRSMIFTRRWRVLATVILSVRPSWCHVPVSFQAQVRQRLRVFTIW